VTINGTTSPGHRRERRLRRRAEAVLVLGTAATVGCGLLADRGVSSVEETVFRRVNGSADRFGRPMYLVQLGGTVAVPVIVSLVAIRHRRHRLGAALLLLLPVKHVLEHRVLKTWVERERPAASGLAAIVRFDAPVEGLAFPSGHSVIAFAVAGLVAPYLADPTARAVFGLAALVGLARIYLGAHSPLDVLGGAAEGLALAAGLKLAFGFTTATR
jgi:undecaprenyl-diphosphatase